MPAAKSPRGTPTLFSQGTPQPVPQVPSQMGQHSSSGCTWWVQLRGWHKMGSQITVRFWGQQGWGSLQRGITDGCCPSSTIPSSYLAAADGTFLVVVRCPAGAVCPVLTLKEAGVGVFLQLLQVPGLGALGELSLPQGLPRGQAGPSCMALVGNVHLEGAMSRRSLPMPMPRCPPWSGLVRGPPMTTEH